MIPLWITAILPEPSVCGWALMSVGAPCVAQLGGLKVDELFENRDPSGRLGDRDGLRVHQGNTG